MKTRFFSSPPPPVRKNGRRISPINDDLALTLTLPTPQTAWSTGRCS
jgi:hypothetical protein